MQQCIVGSTYLPHYIRFLQVLFLLFFAGIIFPPLLIFTLHQISPCFVSFVFLLASYSPFLTQHAKIQVSQSMIPEQCSKTQKGNLTTNQNHYPCSSKFTGNHNRKPWWFNIIIDQIAKYYIHDENSSNCLHIIIKIEIKEMGNHQSNQ